MKKKIDYKIVIIGLLLIAVVCFILFWPKPVNEFDQEELDRLHQENKELLIKNDSLAKDNLQKDKIIKEANEQINTLTLSRDSLDVIIKNINDKRNEIHNDVNNLDNDGVVGGISDYLKRRKSRI